MSPVFAPGREDLGHAGLLERRDVVDRDHAAAEDEDVAGAALPQLRDHLREQRHVGARVAREPDGVGILLDRGLGDLLRRLMQPGVDHLEAGVAQRARDHLGPTVVAVEPRLRHDHPMRCGHAVGVVSTAPCGRLPLGALRPGRRTSGGCAGGYPRDPLREDRRRRAHRLPGRRRRAGRHGLRDGLGLEHRGDVGGAGLRSVPRARSRGSPG